MDGLGLSVESNGHDLGGTLPVSLPRVRIGRRADLDAIYGLDLITFGEDAFSRRSIKNSLLSVSQIVFVAEYEDIIIGAAIVQFIRRAARLNSLAVCQYSRSLGIGSDLLTSAEEWSRLRGSLSIRLEVRADNHTAIAFYEARGYVRIGRKKYYYKDSTDAIRYQKVL